MENNYPQFDTLIEYFYHYEAKTPDNLFLRQPKGDTFTTRTFAEAGQEARKMTTALTDMGLKKGDHIAIYSKNCYHWIMADLAIMMGGFVCIPLYPSLPKAQLQEVLEKSDAKAIFVGKLDAWGNRVEAISPNMPIIHFPHYEGFATVTEGWDWKGLVAKNTPKKENFVPDPNSLWTILFTSGTTGSPKGVMHPHRTPANLIKDEIKTSWLGVFKSKGPHRYFSFLPLNHVAERVAVQTMCIATGGSLTFAENLDSFAKNLQSTQPTLFFAVPRIWTKFYLGVLSKMPQKKLNILLKIPILSGIVKKKLLTALGLSQVRIVATGAAITPAYLKEWYRKLGIHLVEAYGMTEVCGSMTNTPMHDAPLDSVGKVIPGGEIKIHPETGEILMKSPYNMLGYYKEPEMTAAVLRDGWIYSGDKGTIDANGFLRVVGRVKDAFKTSKGSYITPNSMEEVLTKNDFIEQICIAGVNIPQPIAMVNLSDIGKKASQQEVETSLSNDLKDLNETLANHERIAAIIIDKDVWNEENEMLTPTLKVRRNAVDERYEARYEEWYGANKRIIWI